MILLALHLRVSGPAALSVLTTRAVVILLAATVSSGIAIRAWRLWKHFAIACLAAGSVGFNASRSQHLRSRLLGFY